MQYWINTYQKKKKKCNTELLRKHPNNLGINSCALVDHSSLFIYLFIFWAQIEILI